MTDHDTIDVWLIPLPEQGPADSVLERFLSPEEAARAARFIFEHDRARFTAAHAALRNILSRYTGEHANSIVIAAAEKGKPYLTHHPKIRFNLSHSGCCALVAVAHGRELGVDIEAVRKDRLTAEIAERFFAPAEVRELLETPPELRVGAFFACWSRKEAYMKARGLGLGIPLDSFEVGVGEEAILRKAQDRDRWSMYSLEVPAGYAAALVVEGSDCRIRQCDWSGLPET
jgi:4'-phosphopantetheinyl transferase